MMMGVVAGQMRKPLQSGGLYWRLHATASNSGTTLRLMIAELEFRAAPGGSTQATGGVAIASSTFGSGFAPSSAFDGVLTTSWLCANGAALPQWLGYQFASSVGVQQVRVTAADTPDRATRAPTSFTIDSSSDGVSWTTVAAISGLAPWAAGESRLFDV